MSYIKTILYISIFILSNNLYAKPPIFTSSINDAKQMSEDLQLPILQVVSADWCLYCGMLDKTISDNLEVFNDIIILKIDFDTNKDYVEKNNIKKIPTILYKNDRYIGIYDIKDLKKIIK